MKTSKISKKVRIIIIVGIVLVSLFFCCFGGHFIYTTVKKSVKIDYTKFADAESLEYLVKSDWNAEWIWENNCEGNTHVAFRKTFVLDNDPIGNETAYISADSKYTLWINGELVVLDGSPKRGLTPTGTYYQEVALKGLKKGKNVMSVLVWYFGENGYSYNSSGQGGFLFESKVEGKLICSDNSFKVQRQAAFVDDDFRIFDQPNYRLCESNIYFDARKGSFDFIKEDFDDTSWNSANTFGKGGSAPWNKLYLSKTGTIAFDDIKSFENNADFIGMKTSVIKKIELNIGKNVQFTPYFKIKAKAGKRITFVSDTFKGGYQRSPENVYKTKDGIQEFECPYWMSGSALVLTLPAGIEILDAGYRLSGYACYDLSGAFSSSDEKLNLLWQKSANSVLINMRDTYMDCPDRERAQWLGDGVMSAKIAHYLIGDKSYELSSQLYKSLVGWCDIDGIFATVAPNGIEIFELPCQNLAAIVSMYDYYMYSGDIDTLKLTYPLMKQYLDLWQINDGIVEHRKGSWDWGDWGNKIDMPVLENAWYYYALGALSDAAKLFEDNQTYDWAINRRAVLYEGYNNHFWKGNGYSSKKKFDDRGNAIALLSGLADEDKYTGVINVLINVKNSSPYMEKYVDEALFKAGRGKEAIERIKDRYAKMLDSDCTTLWELWSKAFSGINHAWGGGSVILFAEYIAGIKYTGAGYSSYTVQPDLTLLDRVSLKVQTVNGNIEVAWNGGIINITAFSGGEIILPDNVTSLTVNGTTVYDGNFIENDVVEPDTIGDSLIFRVK